MATDERKCRASGRAGTRGGGFSRGVHVSPATAAVSVATFDRARPPELYVCPVALAMPAIVRRPAQRLGIVMVERHSLPVADFILLARTGTEADPPEKPGLSSLTADLLSRGTATRSATAIAEQEALLGVSTPRRERVGSDHNLTAHADRAARQRVGAVRGRGASSRLRLPRWTGQEARDASHRAGGSRHVRGIAGIRCHPLRAGAATAGRDWYPSHRSRRSAARTCARRTPARFSHGTPC